MRTPKAALTLVLAAVIGTLAYAAFGQLQPQDSKVTFEQASAGDDITTTTEYDPGITYIDPETGEQVTIHDRSLLPEGPVTIIPTDDVTTTIAQAPPSSLLSEGEQSEPEPITTTTEAPPPPTTTTTEPVYDHRVIIFVDGPLEARASVNLICETSNQWSWSASGGQSLDTGSWSNHAQQFNCFVNWYPHDLREDFVVGPGTTEVHISV